MPTMDRRELLKYLRPRFALDWRGIHGAPHWARVLDVGLRLAEQTQANVRVVEAFALLHDSCRINDVADPGHGSRAADLAARINDDLLQLHPAELSLLIEACTGHSCGLLEADVTVQTCWDADRLDLGRVGIRPAPERLCTASAREPALIEWAYRRSLV